MKESLYLFGLVIRVIMITMLQLSEQIAIVFSHIFTCVSLDFRLLCYTGGTHLPFLPYFLRTKMRTLQKTKMRALVIQ